MILAALLSLVLNTHLENGMRVIVVPDHLARVTTVVMTYGAGSEDERLPGQAHAVEHMMFRGTPSLSATQYSEIAAHIGAVYNATTTQRYTRYYCTMPSQYLDLMLRIEADRMTHASLRQEDWERERGAIEQEVAARESATAFNLGEQVRSIVYAGTPYVQSGLGTIPSFQKMTAADLREFYDAWYHPNDATLIVAGDVDPQAVLATVRDDFGAIPSAKLPAHPSDHPAALKSQSIDLALPTPFGSLGYIYRLPGELSADWPALQVLLTAMNNPRGVLSDLYFNGKVLGISSTSNAMPEIGTATIAASVRPGSSMDAARSALDAAIASILANGIPEQDVETAKRRLLSADAFDLASISGVAFHWANAVSDGFDSIDADSQAIEAVQKADVDRVLKTYFADAPRLAITARPNGKSTRVSEAPAESVSFTPTQRQPLPEWVHPYVAQIPALPNTPADKQSWVLPNGLRLTVQRVSVAPVVLLRGFVASNESLNVSAEKMGVAEMTDALMNYGSTDLDRRAFTAALDEIPASVRTGTSLYASARSIDFDRALALLADEEMHPAFAASDFDLLKQNFVRSLTAEQTQPNWIASNLRYANLFPQNDPERLTITPKSAAALTLDDVKQWYARAYRPDLTSLVIVGDIDPQHAYSEVMHAFGSWHADGPRPNFAYPQIPLNKAFYAPVISDTERQTNVSLVELLGVTKKNDDWLSLMLGDAVLAGEGFASLLFHDLREDHGYVYGVSTSLDIGKQRSFYGVQFAADPSNVDPAMKLLVADVNRLRTDPVSADELTQAKSYIVSRSIMSLSSYGGVAGALVDDLRDYPDVSTMDAQDERQWNILLGLNPEQVRDAMQKWVRPDDFVRIDITPPSPSAH